MKKFYIARGLPGSGKSTLVKELITTLEGEAFIFSTDNYWLRPDGYYDFNARRIGEAHAWNFKLCCEAFDLGLPNVVLDNTNTTLREFEHYAIRAHKQGYKIFIAEPETSWAFDVNECYKMNVHGVPLDVIQKMKDRWEETNTIYHRLRQAHSIETSFI